ncbi:hypothetical protein RJT34_16068 [Clitoria ternatea]|uniref:Uncharacterized protein n=1 Tax=Clitoria ternatea TaxID=43366 RepID=A0AAN9J6J5_CLITE
METIVVSVAVRLFSQILLLFWQNQIPVTDFRYGERKSLSSIFGILRILFFVNFGHDSEGSLEMLSKPLLSWSSKRSRRKSKLSQTGRH